MVHFVATVAVPNVRYAVYVVVSVRVARIVSSRITKYVAGSTKVRFPYPFLPSRSITYASGAVLRVTVGTGTAPPLASSGSGSSNTVRPFASRVQSSPSYVPSSVVIGPSFQTRRTFFPMR